jgi:transposase
MRQKSVHPESPSERIVKNIRRATRKRHSSEGKIRIVLDGLRGESSIASRSEAGFPKDSRGASLT